MMKVDFPKNVQQSDEIKKQNQALAKKFNVNGLPTVKIIKADESLLLSTGYMNNHTPAMYIDHLKYHLGWDRSKAGSIWLTDFNEAKKQAKELNRKILADFSGSDWCGWCKKLDKEVFAQKVFQDWAKENVIMLLVDFPYYNPLPADQAAANKALADKYNIEGYPTVLVLDAEGNETARTGYKSGGPQNYINHIEGLL